MLVWLVSQIARLEDAWRKAEGLRNRTGAGSWMTAQEVKAASGWDDDNPEWLKLEKVALGEQSGFTCPLTLFWLLRVLLRCSST